MSIDTLILVAALAAIVATIAITAAILRSLRRDYPFNVTVAALFFSLAVSVIISLAMHAPEWLGVR